MTVTVAQVENDLTAYLSANLPTGFTAAQVSWPNAPFTTPNNTPWLRATMTSPFIIDQDAAGEYYEYQGYFIIDIFYPKDTGSQAALTTADEISATFSRVPFAYSFSIRANVSIIGADGPWYHVQVSSLYQFGSFS